MFKENKQQKQPIKTPDTTSPATIRKGIYLSALVYVEGDQAPASDFMGPAKAALADALKGDHNGLSLTLKKVEVQNNVEDDGDDSSKSTGQGKRGSFEF